MSAAAPAGNAGEGGALSRKLAINRVSCAPEGCTGPRNKGWFSRAISTVV